MSHEPLGIRQENSNGGPKMADNNGETGNPHSHVKIDLCDIED